MTEPGSNPDAEGLAARMFGSELFRRLIEFAPDALLLVESDGTIALVNAQCERLFGYPRQELLGRPVELLIPERFRVSHVERRASFSNAPKARPMGSGLELFGCRKDGSEFAAEISLSPFHTARGLQACAAIRDVSQRRAMESAVRRTNENLSTAVESFTGAFGIFDPSDALVFCNSTYRALFGRALEGDLIGRRYGEIVDANIHAGDFDFGSEPADALRVHWLEHHANPNRRFELRTKGGCTIRVADRRTPDGGTVTITSDITADVERQAELERAQRDAEKASAAKTEFLSSMSHELRTPLNAILGFAQLLERDKRAPLSARHRDRLEQVIKGGEHLLRLIDDVLDLSRIEAGRATISLEAVSVAEVIGEVVSTLDSMAARAEMRITRAPSLESLPSVYGDRTRLSQILMNYGSNSIKYGRKHGTIAFSAEKLDSAVRIRVKDDGIGIPLEKQSKIFQPFQRAGQETGPIEGTGVGLAISKRLAELMGGSVGFQSTPGEGSEFWVDLPLVEARESAHDDARPSRRAAATELSGVERTRFLVVYIEDNSSNVALMRALLGEFERITLVTAPTAEIGIELVFARRPDVVIMDIHLPGMSGFDAMRRLRALPETRDIPVIGLSAAAMAEDAQRAKDAGFYCYLTKPVNVDELLAVLERVLSHR